MRTTNWPSIHIGKDHRNILNNARELLTSKQIYFEVVNDYSVDAGS
jgi:hypothetical protein